MRPANHDSVHNCCDLSCVPSIPEVQQMVGFTKENLPGSIRQLKTIGLPLKICSQEPTPSREEEKHKCIKICTGRATVPCLPIDISSPTALQNAFMAPHTIDPGGRLAKMEMERGISYNVASANSDFTTAVQGSAKQRWQVWVQAAEAASLGHMGTYAHNALTFFSTDKEGTIPGGQASRESKRSSPCCIRESCWLFAC